MKSSVTNLLMALVLIAIGVGIAAACCRRTLVDAAADEGRGIGRLIRNGVRRRYNVEVAAVGDPGKRRIAIAAGRRILIDRRAGVVPRADRCQSNRVAVGRIRARIGLDRVVTSQCDGRVSCAICRRRTLIDPELVLRGRIGRAAAGQRFAPRSQPGSACRRAADPDLQPPGL